MLKLNKYIGEEENMITDEEIQKIFDWADKNKIVGKRWKNQKWGINLLDDEINSVKRGIPRDKDTLLKITHLNLSKFKLSDIPSELYKLIKLKDLDISNNEILVLSKDIGNLENLEYLDVSSNLIWHEDSNYSSFSIPEEIKKFKKLRYLNLFDIKLKTLPKEIWELQSLEVLNLGFHDSSIIIPKEIGNLINLIHLELKNLSNIELFAEIGNLVKLEYLKIKDCEKLKYLMVEIGNLENLKHLELEHLIIKELPSEIGNLSKLENLKLMDCELEIIPNEIGNLLKLESLKVNSCDKLEIIPSEIGKLKNLIELELEYLSIKALPKEIGNLSKLENLKLSDCEKLELIPSEIGKLQELKHLDISWNTSLKELPKEVGRLVNLTHLNFRHSGLKKLPDELSTLKNLKFLNDEPYIMLNKKEETPMKEEKNKIDNKKLGNIKFTHKNILLKGVPGTGKSKTIDNIIENNLEMSKIQDNVLRINIHSASSNSDLMQGISISTNDNNDILYEEKKGAVLNHIFKAMYKPNQPFVLVLEEIQENSLNELIGDLIYLIEKDKRTLIALDNEQELSYEELFSQVNPKYFVELPNLVENSESNTKMIMPDNLYVFCTSNYRDDRKVIEDNLLRRFDVVEIYPKYFDESWVDGNGELIFKSEDISKFLEKLNGAILKQFGNETHPDRYLVGHANWLNIEEDDEALFYTALLKVIIEFKEIREVDFNSYVKPILQKLFKKDDELSDRIKTYLEDFYDYKEDKLKLNSYKSLVEKLQAKIYSDFL